MEPKIIKILIGMLLIVSFSKNVAALHSDTIDVKNYAIHLSINISTYQINGYTELTVVPKMNNLSEIPLDLLKLTVDSVYIDGVQNNFSYNDTLLVIHSGNTFNMQDTLSVMVYYHGQPVKDASGWGGFYFSGGYAFNLGVGFAAKPHPFGRVWYPCIDDFIDRATYDCYITVSSANKVVCGGTLKSVTDNGDGTTTYYWRLNDEIPTYLSSVAAGSYVLVPDTLHGLLGDIPINLYVRPADSTKAVNSFVNLKATLAGLEDDFGPYFWERVGYVSVPFNNGAMEHATNIAYPAFAIDGTLNNETLYAHELSHHWFGDLITCNTPEDMWINEGWASYCEPIFYEKVYTKQQAKDYIRSKHEYNLRYLHIEDDGFRAVYGIPHDYTYSTTVYDKGADVAHSLRGYLGDSLFFNSIKAFLNTYKFQPVSSWQMRDFISNYTGFDLTGFFDAWVFQPGWVHFSVDSFAVEPFQDQYKVFVYAKQKLRGRTQFANSNRVPVTFMDNDYNKQEAYLEFSGETGVDTFLVSFQPDFVMVDPEETVCDATLDFYKKITTTGISNFNKTYFIADVVSISDSAFLRAEHNWAAPDPFRFEHKGMILSDARYWTIQGIFPAGFHAKGKFYYSKTGYYDNTLITSNADSITLLYRPDAAHDWEVTPFVKSGNAYNGYLVCDSLQIGQYAMGIYDSNRFTGFIQNLSCSNDHRITANVNGGTAPYQYLWNTGDTISEINITTEGKYTVTVIDANSDTLQLHQWIRFPEELVVTVYADNFDAMAIVNGGTEPYSYYWTAPGGFTSTEQQITYYTGPFFVTVTDANGCVVNGYIPWSVEEINTDKIFLYPNPAQNNIYLNIPQQTKFSAEIVDNNGKTIKKGITSNKVFVGNLAPGNYNIVIKTNKGQKSYNFIKK